jgi:outer membrane biosynthesis protein TonB
VSTLSVSTRVGRPEPTSLALRYVGSAVLAALCHAWLAWFASRAELPGRAALTIVSEVSLAPPPAPAPPPPPPEPVAPPVAAEPKAASRPRAAPKPAAEPRAASAAPLLTANESAPEPEAPVRFVTDPNGTAFGFGSVARGGTAREGTGSSTAPVAPTAPPPVDPDAPFRGALGRPPKLDAFDPCRGFFPRSAQVDRGDAAVRVIVAADGRVRNVAVVAERPAAQGFGPAARACLLATRFEPALDTSGRAVVAVAPITVKFSR